MTPHRPSREFQRRESDWAFISSGTWSLVGCVLDSACVNAAARSSNFSNEGGVGGKIYFLKNVNGMWLLRQCIEHWRLQGQVWTVEQLVEACASLGAPENLIDVDDPDLLLPGDMPARINAQLKRAGQVSIPEGPDMAARMTNLILHSLAARYAAVLQDAARITGRNSEAALHRRRRKQEHGAEPAHGQGNRASSTDGIDRKRDRRQLRHPTGGARRELH